MKLSLAKKLLSPIKKQESPAKNKEKSSKISKIEPINLK